MQNHQLNNKVNEQITSSNKREARPGYGIIIDYNEQDNTATVLLAEPSSDAPGQYFTGVPCPTMLGVQSVAPEIGRPCWVMFRDGLQSSPVITHYFHHSYQDMEYDQQYYAVNSVPRFMMDL
jgi:hypothetical protein